MEGWATQRDFSTHHRHSTRLRGYDYSLAGMCFVTICISDRACLLGSMSAGRMDLTAAGRVVENEFSSTPSHYDAVDVDRFVVMPNHAHAIIVLAAGPIGVGVLETDIDRPRMATLKLGDIVRDFKLRTTNLYRTGVKKGLWPRYPGTLWQRNYHEHIIRRTESLNRIREYISLNPLRWELDRENPCRTGDDPFDLWLDSIGDDTADDGI